jgi:hypothetical protein
MRWVKKSPKGISRMMGLIAIARSPRDEVAIRASVRRAVRSGGGWLAGSLAERRDVHQRGDAPARINHGPRSG